MGLRNNLGFILFVFFLCFSYNNHPSHGANTISANQSLTGDQTIVSSGGKFELGFYKPGNSSNYYISMWYKKLSTDKIVWVANREAPVSDKYSSELKIIDGNLVLLNGSQIQVWSTNQSSTTSTNSVVAVLLDDGNLVLGESPNLTQTPVWQSFDHPAHTWLPGSKISYNKRTKTHQYLTSWKNSEDPAPGLFSLILDQTQRQYLLLWNGSENYWSSGAWDNQSQIFSLVPEMNSKYLFDFSYVDNENESYFTYNVKNSSSISRFIMDVSGQVKVLSWLENSGQWNLFWSQPRQQCQVHALCGAFGTCNDNTPLICDCLTGFHSKNVNDWNLNDYSGGCVRDVKVTCGNSSASGTARDKFGVYSNMKLPDLPQSVGVRSAAECESNCLSNCSCTAYAYNESGCSIWIGDLLNLQQLSADDASGRTLYVRLAASGFPNGKNHKGIIIGVVAGSAAIVILLGLVFVVLRKRQMRLIGTTKVEGTLVAFGFKDLQNATKNFSVKLGGGGFGSVFKGTLPDSIVIAVKRLESITQGEKQFRTEVSTIGAVQHVNLVRLRGFCSEGNNKMLVYDFMSNGSLDSNIFNVPESKVLDWKTRYQIALGTARGLAYLHESCRDCIIHCDVKPENILLDAEFCPKVADFGLAKLVGRDFSRVLTTMRGTRGYLAPEWISGVAVTAKADVYSYGMMLFEIVSGARNSEPSEDGKIKFFPTWAATVVIEGGDVLSLLDKKLDRIADSEELRRICKVACWCIQDDENRRPTMGQMVQILEGVLGVNPPPLIPRSLQILADNQGDIVFFTESSSGQSSQLHNNTSTGTSQTKSTTSSLSSKSWRQ